MSEGVIENEYCPWSVALVEKYVLFCQISHSRNPITDIDYAFQLQDRTHDGLLAT